MNFDKNKPSLNSLFESKKLDLPKTQFWDQFQNEVKGKVVASASRPNLSQRFAKISTIIVPVYFTESGGVPIRCLAFKYSF